MPFNQIFSCSKFESKILFHIHFIEMIIVSSEYVDRELKDEIKVLNTSSNIHCHQSVEIESYLKNFTEDYSENVHNKTDCCMRK